MKPGKPIAAVLALAIIVFYYWQYPQTAPAVIALLATTLLIPNIISDERTEEKVKTSLWVVLVIILNLLYLILGTTLLWVLAGIAAVIIGAILLGFAAYWAFAALFVAVIVIMGTIDILHEKFW